MNLQNSILVLSLLSCSSWGAQIAPPEPFHLLRYEENYEYLRESPGPHGLEDEIKFLPLSPDASSHVTFGGEFREKYEIYENEGWGSMAAPDKRLLHRVMFDSDFHFDGTFRVFLELKSGFVSWNSYPPRSTLDEDDLDLNNLFIERKFDLGESLILTPRVGMQEIEYGGGRLIAVREGPNVRQGFDGFKFILNRNLLRWDNLWVLPVPTNPGVFDDHPSIHQQLWVSYFTTPILNLYYIGWRNDGAIFDAGVGNELRHTIGARIFRSPKSKGDYDLEGTFQFGSFGSRSIEAFMLASNIGYTFYDWIMEPRLALKASIASGDHNRGNGSLGTFNPLFPRRNLLDPSFVMTSANMVNIGPFITLHPAQSVEVTTGYNSYWRESSNDGIYSPSMTLIRGAAGASDHFIGAGPWFNTAWQVNRAINLTMVYVHTSAGGYIQESGPAADVNYGAFYAYFVF